MTRGAINAERREQVAETQLKSDDSVAGRSDLEGRLQAARGFDVDEESDAALDAAPLSSSSSRSASVRTASGPSILGRLRYRGPAGLNASRSASKSLPVRTDWFAQWWSCGGCAKPRRAPPQRAPAPVPYCRGYRVLQVERQRVRFRPPRLLEQLRAGPGHKQLAAHGFQHRRHLSVRATGNACINDRSTV